MNEPGGQPPIERHVPALASRTVAGTLHEVISILGNGFHQPGNLRRAVLVIARQDHEHVKPIGTSVLDGGPDSRAHSATLLMTEKPGAFFQGHLRRSIGGSVIHHQNCIHQAVHESVEHAADLLLFVEGDRYRKHSERVRVVSVLPARGLSDHLFHSRRRFSPGRPTGDIACHTGCTSRQFRQSPVEPNRRRPSHGLARDFHN